MEDLNARHRPLVVPARTGPDAMEALERAAQVMARGGVVAYPTESFYGLGADPESQGALERLMRAKGRPEGRPILLLIPRTEAMEALAARVPLLAYELAERFWPGGLTLVLEAAEGISPLLTAGSGKIGVRVSSHTLARGLCTAFGGAVTGTSANISGMPPCRSARGVLSALGARVDLVLDGGETPGRSPSTVLDVSVSPPRILREGMITAEALQPYLRKAGAAGDPVEKIR